jgi:hypothetical protein
MSPTRVEDLVQRPVPADVTPKKQIPAGVHSNHPLSGGTSSSIIPEARVRGGHLTPILTLPMGAMSVAEAGHRVSGKRPTYWVQLIPTVPCTGTPSTKPTCTSPLHVPR